MTPSPWHAEDLPALLHRIGSDAARGLSRGEAAERLQRHGRNELPEGKRRGPLQIFVAQFADLMVVVLVAAAVVAGMLGEPQDSLAIAAIVVLNAVLGFVQEYRAERAMAALKTLAAPSARVKRDGVVSTVPAVELVPGDLVLLEAGNVVPADVRLVEAAQLRIVESALTGESVPAEKRVVVLRELDLAVGDRVNMAYKGTTVALGRGLALVVATGGATELGRIATLLQEEGDVRTPLQRRLETFARRLAGVVLVLCAVVFAAGLVRGEDPVAMFLTAVSLAVAAIPEALPAVVTVALALGARRMAAHNALVRRLPAVETLGSVTTICTDKTGTLTLNRMRVAAWWGVEGRVDAPGHDARWAALLDAMALDNDAEEGEDGVSGDPTEVALYEAAAAAGHTRAAVEARLPRVGELPFSSERGRMTTFHPGLAFTKGAPERVLELCSEQVGADGRRAPLDVDAARDAAVALARDGLRVLAFAVRHGVVPGEGEAAEQDLALLGLVGLRDPPRPEARAAVELCHTAGIRVVMITGDHPATASAIARDLDIAGPDQVLNGRDLDRLSEDALVAKVRDVRVYARAAPEQKIDIVKALQARGEIVAMTGDGVNDAPALRRAEIGIAMGRGGTDVAREAAHMVLLDDNFATIVTAVREGRRIYDNVRRFVRYAMTGNSGEIWTIFLAPFLGLPIPLLPIHILWVNLVTDGLPGLALAVEPAEPSVMRRPPRPPGESVFAHGLWQHTLWVGLLLGACTLGAQAWGIAMGWHWQSMTFTVLTLSQLGHALAVRSERASLATLGLFSNLPLLGAVVGTFVLQLLTLYVPALNAVFHTEPLTARELVVCLLLSSVVFVAVEIEKAVKRLRWPTG